MSKLFKTSAVLALALALAVGAGSLAFAAKAPKPPAETTTAVFKLNAERSLKSGESPATAVNDAALKIIAYIDKNGGSWKVLPNGNGAGGKALNMPSDAATGQYTQIIEVYSATVDGCVITAEGGKMSVVLPWEIAVYTDGSGKIRVNMLAPTGVVKVMATDPACVASVAKSAEDNLSKFVQTALGRGWSYPQAYMEPKLTQAEVDQARTMTWAPQVAIAVPAGADPAVFTRQVRDSIRTAVDAERTVLPQGWHVQRIVDFTGANVANTYSLELCSPYYAGQALSMGRHHAPALPCQVGVWYDGTAVQVSVLDPNFIFGVFFKDAIAQMTPEQLEMFQQLPAQVMLEICTMVNTGIAPYTSARF